MVIATMTRNKRPTWSWKTSPCHSRAWRGRRPWCCRAGRGQRRGGQRSGATFERRLLGRRPFGQNGDSLWRDRKSGTRAAPLGEGPQGLHRDREGFEPGTSETKNLDAAAKRRKRFAANAPVRASVWKVGPRSAFLTTKGRRNLPSKY